MIIKTVTKDNLSSLFDIGNIVAYKISPVLPTVNLVPINYIPTPTGNTLNTQEFVTDPNGDIFYCDYIGDSIKLTKPTTLPTTIWNTIGNTTLATDFIGSNNAERLTFKTNNVEQATILVNGNVGLGTSTPNANLQLANSFANRKLVLQETANNDHQVYGLGVTSGLFRHQVDATTSRHGFFAGINGTSSNELMTILGTGNVGIGTSTPTNKLQITQGTAGNSGLTLTNLTNATLGTDSTGIVINRVTFIPLVANFISTSNVRTNIPGWSFNVVAGKTYKIEIIASFTSTVTTTGVSMGIVLGTGGVGTIRGYMEGDISTATVATALRTPINTVNTVNTTANSFITTTSVSVINTAHSLIGLMAYTCTTSSTVNIQFASEVNLSSVTLLSNSSLIITQLN